MRKLFLVAGIAAATLQLAYSQDGSTSRRDPDTELLTRHPGSGDPHYARVDRVDELFETHSTPGDNGQGPNSENTWIR